MPRKEVISIQNSISQIFLDVSIIIKKLNEQIDCEELQFLVNFCSNPFEDIKSEHRFFKILHENGQYEYPICLNIDNVVGEVVRSGIPTFDTVTTNAYIMPIKF